MCTLTWIITNDGYELFMNRDERRARGTELPPALLRSGDARYLAPRDSDGGGTWIAVNDRGLGLALLNGYRAGDVARADFESRGLLVSRLIGEDGQDAVEQVMTRLDLAPFRSFMLAAFEPGRRPRIVEWNGSRVEFDRSPSDRSPLVSSAFDSTRVRERRLAAFAALETPRGATRLIEFHRGHAEGKSAYSVCMHRDDAETRSFSRVHVARGCARLEHHAGPPCAPGPISELALELSRRVVRR